MTQIDVTEYRIEGIRSIIEDKWEKFCTWLHFLLWFQYTAAEIVELEQETFNRNGKDNREYENYDNIQIWYNSCNSYYFLIRSLNIIVMTIIYILNNDDDNVIKDYRKNNQLRHRRT